MDSPSVEQAGDATVWFTTQAGITATVLAVVSISLAIGLVILAKLCRSSFLDVTREHTATVTQLKTDHERILLAVKDSHEAVVLGLTTAWGKRLDDFRADIKEAFSQNDDIADKVVAALQGVQNEVARMSGRMDYAKRQ